MNFFAEYWLGSFILILVFCFINILKNKNIKNILFIAFFLRVTLLLLSYFEILIIPDNNYDAQTYISLAKEFSENYGYLIIYDFYKTDSLLLVRIYTLFFVIFGESAFLLRSMSVLIGTACVYLVFKLSLLLWDSRSAEKAAWVAAFFPTLILYSVLTLREVYIVFILLMGLISFIKLYKKLNFINFLKFFGSFFILIYFHGPLFIGAIFLFFIIIIKYFKILINQLYRLKINISLFLILILSLIPIIYFLFLDFQLPYLYNLKILSDLDFFKSIINSRMEGSAAYPSWLIINNNYEIVPKIIIKILYFLYSPFFWDIEKISHLVGNVDGLLYLIITFYLIKNWKIIWINPITRILFLLLVCYLIVYGLGVGNFGAGIRHRSKFVVILIVLAAPKLKKFIFSSEKRIYKK